jgi:hypothetical protein
MWGGEEEESISNREFFSKKILIFILFMGEGDCYTFIPLWVVGLGLYPRA